MFSSTLALATMLIPATAHADDDGLSEAQTSYIGAEMLVGETDVVIGDIDVGDMGLEEGQSRYAFFTGNTLYFGVEDDFGNSVDGISEFFWFESSIDRGSDFYVAVIKVRTTPNVTDNWYLEVGSDPVNFVRAEADTSLGNGAFRWDWSVPFENYGMDSYGEVTLTTEYGIGGSGEGSAMAARKIQEDGSSADVNVQAKGYVSSEYRVATQYQVTLYRWNTVVQGGAGYMDWAVTLETSDRDEQSAYHEYFLVMQVEEGETFSLDRLDIGGAINGWWWGQSTTLGVALTDIELSRPSWDGGGSGGDSGGDSGDGGWDTGDWDTGGDGWEDDSDADNEDDGSGGDLGFGSEDEDEDEDDATRTSRFGCSSSTGTPAGTLAIMGLLGLAFVGRRKDV
jgi:MYXO-CTERM domain-containing protein